MAGMMARQVSSKSRIVALSIVPARAMPATALWIASKASLLNLPVAAIANLHQLFGFQFLADLDVRLCGKEVGVDPVATPLGDDDASAPVFIEAFLEHAAAK